MEQIPPTMQKDGAEDVHGEPDASHDENQLGVLDRCDADESLDGLKQNTNTQREQEHAIEESTERLSPLPAKRQTLG